MYLFSKNRDGLTAQLTSYSIGAVVNNDWKCNLHSPVLFHGVLRDAFVFACIERCRAELCVLKNKRCSLSDDVVPSALRWV